jgi:hypothetical protein
MVRQQGGVENKLNMQDAKNSLFVGPRNSASSRNEAPTNSLRRHVLFICGGLFLQLAISGQGAAPFNGFQAFALVTHLLV